MSETYGLDSVVVLPVLDLPPMEKYHKSVRCTVVSDMTTTKTNLTGADLHTGRDWTQIKLTHLSNVAIDLSHVGHRGVCMSQNSLTRC